MGKKQENQERWSEQLVEPKLAVSKKAAASRSSRDIESCATGTAHIRKDAHEGRGRRDPQTTVMLRNMPNNYSRDMLLSMMDAEGLAGRITLCTSQWISSLGPILDTP